MEQFHSASSVITSNQDDTSEPYHIWHIHQVKELLWTTEGCTERCEVEGDQTTNKTGTDERLEQMKDITLKYVTMPGSSWKSFFQSLQSASRYKLILKNLNTDDTTINLENSSRVE